VAMNYFLGKSLKISGPRALQFNGDTFTVKLPLIPRFIIIHDPDCVEHILKSHFNVRKKLYRNFPASQLSMLSYSILWILKQNYVKGPHFHENLKELLGDGKAKPLLLQS
jgi:hypothetical protein